MFYKQLKNGKIRYFEKFKINGVQKQVSITLTSRTKVIQAKAKEILHTKIENYHKNFNLKLNDSTVNDIKNLWIDYLNKSISKSSLISYLSSIKDYFSLYGNYQLNKITSAQLQAYFTKNNWSHKTVKHKRSVMLQFHSFAIKIGALFSSPLENILIARKKRDLNNSKFGSKKYITKGEMRIILDFCETHVTDKRHTYLMELLFLTSLRLEEAGAIQINGDIDFESKTFQVKHAIYTKATLKNSRMLYPTKTEASEREISQ